MTYLQGMSLTLGVCNLDGMLTKEGRSNDLRSCKRPFANQWLCQFSDVVEVKMQNIFSNVFILSVDVYRFYRHGSSV